jgi:hypothetical protein
MQSEANGNSSGDKQEPVPVVCSVWYCIMDHRELNLFNNGQIDFWLDVSLAAVLCEPWLLAILCQVDSNLWWAPLQLSLNLASESGRRERTKFLKTCREWPLGWASWSQEPWVAQYLAPMCWVSELFTYRALWVREYYSLDLECPPHTCIKGLVSSLALLGSGRTFKQWNLVGGS